LAKSGFAAIFGGSRMSTATTQSAPVLGGDESGSGGSTREREGVHEHEHELGKAQELELEQGVSAPRQHRQGVSTERGRRMRTASALRRSTAKGHQKKKFESSNDVGVAAAEALGAEENESAASTSSSASRADHRGGRRKPQRYATLQDLRAVISYRRAHGIVDTRTMKEVPQPADHRLASVLLYSGVLSGDVRPSVIMLRKHLEQEGRLEEEAALRLIEGAAAVFREEPNVLELERDRWQVFGDVHGQFYDVLNLLDKVGSVQEKPCLWLGDYADRGMFGTETLFMLLAMKLNHPQRFYMLRGNHESREITDHFNFKQEVFHKYSERVYDAIMALYDTLPLAATLTMPYGRFFFVHGGIGPSVTSVDDVLAIDRFHEPPQIGAFCEVLWTDPITEDDYPHMSLQELEQLEYMENKPRGIGCVFGRKALQAFLDNNKFDCLVRGHEVQQFGYTEHKFGDWSRSMPLCITVFSASNYCDMYENYGAWMVVGREHGCVCVCVCVFPLRCVGVGVSQYEHSSKHPTSSLCCFVFLSSFRVVRRGDLLFRAGRLV
jgi:diadenosine tetraphosphatase ApaH/serine/threonine PP2A family protein phosphatase